MAFAGPEVLVVENVVHSVGAGYESGTAQFSFSNSPDLLVYAAGGINPGLSATPVRVDRDGNEHPLERSEAINRAAEPRISWDGKYILFAQGKEIWLYRVEEKRMERQYSGGGSIVSISWGPEANEFTYIEEIGDTRTLWKREMEQTSNLSYQIEVDTEDALAAIEWSRQGDQAVVLVQNPETDLDIWRMDRQFALKPFVTNPFADRAPTISPDGKRMAYMRSSSGNDSDTSIYIMAFSGEQKFVDGGPGRHSPAWSGDQRELFYIRGGKDLEKERELPRGQYLVAVPLRQGPNGLEADRDKKRAVAPVLVDSIGYSAGIAHRKLDVFPNGAGFVFLKSLGGGHYSPKHFPSQLQIVQNFFTELREKAPVP